MEDVMRITPLGSGQEVGRSCHLLEFRGTTILLDCGVHPGYDGLNGLPFFDRLEPEQVDVLLITHFHLDHAASLPYFTERTGFKGRIFMTHPTKAVIRLLLGDYLRLMAMKKGNSGKDDKSDVLYTEAELQACVDKIELIDYHQTISLGRGLKFYALNAGHVLGAAMFFIEIGGRTVLYTGDYSMEEDRHLMAAEVPVNKPDVLMVEATYGVQVHASRKEREGRFTKTVENVVTRGGRCLIPVFALGRAQELLLILDEYWQSNPQLQNIPIWYASKMASRALRVYQTYANMMNARIRAQMDVANPFHFQHIKNLKSIDVDSFDDRGPSVVFASPGMLQSGVSRQLFDRWASDPKNGCLIAGYAVENTLAKEIMLEPKEVVTLEGRRQPLNCLVEYVSFSAHVDFMQNRNFISRVDPKHIILVHGAKDEMGRLKSALMLQHRQLPENKRPTVTMPPNLQEVKLKFSRRRSAKVMGSLADREDEPQEAEEVNGIIVTQNFNSKILAPKDLQTYTPLRVGSVTSKLHVPFSGQLSTLRLFLNEMFAEVEERSEGFQSLEDESGGSDPTEIIVFSLHEKQVTITTGKARGIAIVEWTASPVGDILADSVIALLMHAQSSAASIKLTSKPCSHRRSDQSDLEEDAPDKKRPRTDAMLRLFHDTLLQQFDAKNIEASYEARKATFEIKTDAGLESGALDGDCLACNVTVEFEEGNEFDAKITVECEDAKLSKNIQESLRGVAEASAPIKP
ncbi:metallo-hydrolase/oxidoreductase [Chaetoceros tenuissimus]|uniref:Metallo-hydrolase/oxidoreductase n=1 Tax=Chaetoceros tenuissimus TaxID=426638 RepID=A0AAD3CZ23_9STRA|nr:metallo-hydrolase/oxidoreductase [Chaetoceros tenuissimus]